MNKDILPENSKGEYHGYCKEYWDNGELFWKGVMINGREYGYGDMYDGDGTIDENETGYWMNGKIVSVNNEDGNCYIWNKRL